MVNVLRKGLIKCYNAWIYYKRDFPMRVKRRKDFFYRITHKMPKVMSVKDTAEYIINNRCSCSRFGDGEMKIVCGTGINFQNYDERLSARLKEILNTSEDEYFVCISDMFGSLRFFNKKSRRYMLDILADNRKKWLKAINIKRTFGNTFVTRCYIDWKDRSSSKCHFELLKRIWTGRDTVIVEGKYSRLGVGNDLFESAKSIERILCPAKNAFSKYDEILKFVTERVSKDKLVLLALGPTATVLGYDLDKLGYQAVDIGHADVEYEWCLMGAEYKVPIKNKYVNEANNGEIDEDNLDDKTYKNQIIGVIDG